MEPTNRLKEEVLLKRLQQGDKDAFEAIFYRHYKPLCAFALRYLESRPVAEELIQDSMIKLWERRDNFQSTDHLSAFLYMTTRNACLDSIKMEGRRIQRDYQYSLESDDSENAIEAQIIEAELLAEIHTAIERLPTQCRKIFELSFHERLSGREIAELLNISISTVNNQKARGITLLRRRISAKGLMLLTFFL